MAFAVLPDTDKQCEQFRALFAKFRGQTRRRYMGGLNECCDGFFCAEALQTCSHCHSGLRFSYGLGARSALNRRSPCMSGLLLHGHLRMLALSRTLL